MGFILCRQRSKSEGYPERSKSEGECCDLRETKSLMLLPHLALGLWPKTFEANREESDVVVKFPEKSVLLLAQDEGDQVHIELSTSSVASPNSQQTVRRRRGDSGVHISDSAVLTWRKEERSRSDPTISSISGLFGNQPHVRRVATKSSLQSNYIPSLEKLIEEPLFRHNVSLRKQNSSAAVLPADSGCTLPIERKDIGEVVVSHWERAEQHRKDTEQCIQESNNSRSFENKRRSSSLSLVNEVTEEVLFKRSSSNVSSKNGCYWSRVRSPCDDSLLLRLLGDRDELL